MARMLSASGVVALLEAAHVDEPDWQRWTLRLVEGANRAFTESSVHAVSATRDEGERVQLIGFGQNGMPGGDTALGQVLAGVPLGRGVDPYATPLPADVLAQFRMLDPRWVKVFYRHGRHVVSHHEIVTELPPGVVDVNQTLFDAGGFRDAIALQGSAGGFSIALVRPLRDLARTTPREGAQLLQIALHLESAMRVRVSPSAVMAVLRPDGRVSHAEGRAARKTDDRVALTRYVRRVEHTRLAAVRRRADAIDAWSALAAGRWGLLERTDRDGSRFYLAVESAPSASVHRALSRTEYEVLQLCARGVTGKMVAYGLGLSEPTVSAALASAALKLGVRSRTAAVQLASSLMGLARQVTPSEPLTPAELEVLNDVRRGYSNAEIAAARRSSPRTVANQVAEIMRKLDVPSRRAVASLQLARDPRSSPASSA